MLLAMDTATQTASIALYDYPPAAPQSGRLLAEWTWQARRRQTQDLALAVQNLLTQVGAAPVDLTALAVTTGPGSFTGVRIAAGVAKGMAVGLPHPVAVVGAPVLAVTAAPWLEAAGRCGAQVWAYLQAGRGQLNWCVFDRADLLWRPTAQDHARGRPADLASAVAAAQAPVWLAGEWTPEVGDAVRRLAHVTCVDGPGAVRRAGHLARLAALHLAQGQGGTAATLAPLYLNPL